MSSARINALFGGLAALALTSCGGASVADPVSADGGDDQASSAARCLQTEPLPVMGLMSSLPLNFPLGADFADFARGEVAQTWQSAALRDCVTPLPLDTLSPIGGLKPGEPDSDPLADLEYLAVIQPRGLSPDDNVALDDWVRAGGKLLLMLDPMLTGEYELALGDPRRPAAVALIPPVAERWGMSVTFDDAQEFAPRRVAIGDYEMPVLLAGEVVADGADCVRSGSYAVQKCAIGKGSVTLVADAAIFEEQALAGSGNEAIHALLAFAFDR